MVVKMDCLDGAAKFHRGEKSVAIPCATVKRKTRMQSTLTQVKIKFGKKREGRQDGKKSWRFNK
eukprot:SAG11_NODE_64_length_18817_cov_64.238327_18_plen_64_part_00